MVLNQVLLDVELDGFTWLLLGNICDPRVFKEIADGGSCKLILVETLQDEVLGVLADAEPVRAVKFNLLVANVLVNSFDIFTIKRSDTGQ